MIVPGSANPLLLASSAGYQIANSLRFRASNSAYLSRTSGASPTDQKKVTYSTWMKATPSLASTIQVALASSAGNNGLIAWNTSSYAGRLFIRSDSANDIQFTGLFRDPSAWGHLVVAIDTTQATSSDRVKVYWNGVAMTYNSGAYPSLNSNTYLNAASTAYRIMQDTVNGWYLDGYLANVYMIDGQALTPSSFGQTDATTGVWVPKAYSGTFGANGFFLQFKDAASTTTIGYDTSGNSNNFTTSGISVTSGTTFDQMTDTPTLNYAVMNTADKGASMSTSNGGLRVSNTSGGSYERIRSSIGMTTGKWYAEFVIDTESAPSRLQAGLMTGSAGITTSFLGNGDVLSWSIYESGGSLYKVYNSTATLYVSGNTLDPTDVHMIAYDADAGKFWYGKNGTWFASGNPASGTNEMFSSVSVSGQAMFFASSAYNSSDLGTWNFGQRAFSYTPPTGFKALNTANLSVPTIKKPSLYMDATLRTGTGATASVSSLGFQPDLVWIKSRSAATDHGLYDSVRGVQKQIESNTTTGETTETTGLTAFNSNGYTVGSLAQLNTNTATYVDWAWKKGITPGFDIVTYTGNGTNRTISHSLGAVPKFMTVKRLDTGNGWPSYHVNQNASPASGYMYLNSTAGFAAASTMWNSTAPTSSVFSVGTNSETNGNTFSFVAYLWAEIDGYSKFSSYTGNASADGPFVWCGFRPAFVMIKRSDSAENWSIQDDARNPLNVVDARLKPNSADAEAVSSVQNVDFLANGFKLRNTDPEKNASGGTYIFAAFAETPFKYTRAR